MYNDGYRDGTLLIRTAEHRQGHCPIQYLQEVWAYPKRDEPKKELSDLQLGARWSNLSQIQILVVKFEFQTFPWEN